MTMSTRIYKSLGIMTGTSLDGIDLSIIKSDGSNKLTLIDGEVIKFSNKIRDSLKSVIGFKKRNKLIELVELEYTNFVIKKIKNFLKINNHKIDIIGFHGQTIFHNPKEKISLQIGNPKRLYETFRVPIVYNFRMNDIINGGNGAPLTPIFHDLLRRHLKLTSAAFLNLGGISNITISDNKNLIAFDCGPCCSISNKFIYLKLKKEFDKSGFYASQGKHDYDIVSKLLKNKYFKKDPPKSLDVQEIDVSTINSLNLNDGLATINEFIAETINLAINKFSIKINKIILLGGGRKNKDLKKRLNKKVNKIFLDIDDLKINGDLIESYAFAYLAIRSLKKMSLSFPKTTGVKRSITGGDIII
tara:strand:+ start:13444 stop:14520 length:1077 start_codon:yes stop_codon:yes gene_type:complete